MAHQLGIDTGGTYTDAVLLDSAGQVVAKHKSLTTGYDLSIGIGDALANLPAAVLRKVNLVALSTTLSTNSVVEGRGAPVSVLLPGYNEQQIAKSGLGEIIGGEFITALGGGHDALGNELAPLDATQAARVIERMRARVSAFAVSALFATRNNAHENQLRELVRELTGLPVACGHELASGLGAPRRALTAALNARMIPYIHNLIESMRKILKQQRIDAPLMIVKGDGSLVNFETALRQPVATVLSGPAASVIGACALSGVRDAIVVDMGGTTTDIAVVADGRPELCEDGARIGDWRPMVRAIRVFSIGLGGDSEVRFAGALTLSNRRVVPMSLLAHQFPQVIEKLKRQLKGAPSARNNRFALRMQQNEALLRALNREEQNAWAALADGPIELESLGEHNRPRLRALAKMERMGLVIYSGFTPSDATHALGLSAHWDADAAKLGAQLWARQMRHLYGCGDWRSDDVQAPCREVATMVVRQICQKLIEAGLNQHDALSEAHAQNLTALLADLALGAADAARAPLFELRFARAHPLIAVGGPAQDYFPEVAKQLRMQLHLPTHFDIANAVGAARGAVVQTAQITVTQPQFGVFYLFHKSRPMVFERLEDALTQAGEIAVAEAAALAKTAGAAAIETRLEQNHNHVKHDIDGELFVSATITAVATGRPAV